MGTEIPFWLSAFLSPVLFVGLRMATALKSWGWALRPEGWRERERALPLKSFLFAWHWGHPPSALGPRKPPCVTLGGHQRLPDLPVRPTPGVAASSLGSLLRILIPGPTPRLRFGGIYS